MAHCEDSTAPQRVARSGAGASAAAALVLAAGLGMAGMGGCRSMTESAIEPAARPAPRAAAVAPAPASDRPMVRVTAADLYSWGPGAASQQLEFYDELERRDLVAHDDLLHAALLFADGSSGATYQQRLELAKGHGWVDARFSRPGREAVTVGEAAQVMARMMEMTGAASQQAAVAEFRGLGLVPETAQAEQGLTGPQLLALLTNSYDYLQAGASPEPRPMAAQGPGTQPPVTLPDTPAAAANRAGGIESFDQFEAPAAAAATPAPATARPAPIAAEAPIGATETPRAMQEPLPEVPLRETPPPTAVPTPPPPSAQPGAAAAPAPRPTPTPRPWVGGRPLKGKRDGGR